jgi:hypothetical protein
MHTYKKISDNEWEVGIYINSVWYPIKKFKREDLAAEYVSYLNGGESLVGR